jgi:YVTN family beta-propeller protein
MVGCLRPSARVPFLFLGVLWICLAGCGATLPQIGTRPEGDGVVYLYLQPLPQEADRLTVHLDAIAALRSGGGEVPLSVSLSELRGQDARRQRLLAVGFLPPGEYAGFSFRIADASLANDAGGSALLVPEAPTKIEFAFSVVREKGYVLSLLLRYGESVDSGYRFSPAFAIFMPDKPPVNRMGLVSNSQSNDIAVFDKKSLQVVDMIATGKGPSGMALDQRTRRAYVAITGEDGVDVIDLQSGNISDKIRLYQGDEPREVALTPDGRILLSANAGSNTVSIIDTDSRAEVTRVQVGSGPRSVTIEQTGRRAFVFNNLSNTISVLDIPGRVVITTIAVDPGPVRGQFNRQGDRLYVIHELSPYILTVNPQTLSVLTRIPVRSGMGSIKVDPGTDLVYLGRLRDFVVGLHEPVAFAPVGYVDTGASIAHMAVDGDDGNLFLVNANEGRVLAASLISRRIIREIDVGAGPYWVIVMGER